MWARDYALRDMVLAKFSEVWRPLFVRVPDCAYHAHSYPRPKPTECRLLEMKEREENEAPGAHPSCRELLVEEDGSQSICGVSGGGD